MTQAARSTSHSGPAALEPGIWTTIHDAAGTSKGVTATAEGTYEYQVRACSGAGCSGYSGIATVSVALPPTTSGGVPGAIPGSFSVGTQGDASYTIPITVPAGTGGLKPGLALSYNHLAGNGLAGLRWTLSGIASITECSRTFAQDGVWTVPYDRYCLNGQRLVNVSGDYGAAGTEYRTELESFQLNQYLGTDWQLQISTGAGTAGGNAISVPTTNASKVLIADYDGDGRDDLLRPDGDYWRVHRLSGTALEGSYSASVYSPGAASAAAFVADIAGKGLPQIVRTSGAYWHTHPHNGGLADVVTDITDGLGRTISVEYESLAQTDAYTLDLTHAPSQSNVRRFGGARYVVTAETHDDGLGGTREITHAYDTAFVNTAGRGWQSFRKHTITDAVEGVYSVTQYSQAFPTAGMVELAELKTIGGDDTVGTADDRLVRSVDPVATASAIAGTTPQRQFVRVEQTTTVEKEVGGPEDADTLRTIVEDPAYDTTYGFIASATRTVTEPGVTGSFTTTTDFDRGVIVTADEYCLGLPGLGAGQVLTTQSLPSSGPSATRRADYTYNAADCSLDTVTDFSEQSDTTKQLRRKFVYDGFGNVQSMSEYSVAGGPGTARTTTFDFDNLNPQFRESVTLGGVNLTTLLDFDPRLGIRTSVTGPDGVTTAPAGRRASA